MMATKKPTRTQLVKKCDVLFSKIIRSRGACEHCGKGFDLQCAHGFSRRYRNVRWDARQCFALCRSCHVYYTHRPIEWDLWLLERWGVELYVEIRETALGTSKIDLEALYDELRSEWAALEAA